MPETVSTRRPLLWGPSSFLFWACASLSAQPPKAGEGTERLVLEKNWGTKESADELKQFQAWRKGEQPLTDASKTILEHGAQFYAYRLTHSEFHDSKPGPGGKMLHD